MDEPLPLPPPRRGKTCGALAASSTTARQPVDESDQSPPADEDDMDELPPLKKKGKPRSHLAASRKGSTTARHQLQPVDESDQSPPANEDDMDEPLPPPKKKDKTSSRLAASRKGRTTTRHQLQPVDESDRSPPADEDDMDEPPPKKGKTHSGPAASRKGGNVASHSSGGGTSGRTTPHPTSKPISGSTGAPDELAGIHELRRELEQEKG
jgi:hypothetical protein